MKRSLFFTILILLQIHFEYVKAQRKVTSCLYLGNMASKVSTFEGKTTTTVKTSAGETGFDSCVGIGPDGVLIRGKQARAQRTSNPLNTFPRIKSLIGRNYDDASTQKLLQELNYKTVRAADGTVNDVSLCGTQYAPSDLIAPSICATKTAAEQSARVAISNCIIVVPQDSNVFVRKIYVNMMKTCNCTDVELVTVNEAAVLSFAATAKNATGIYCIFHMGAGSMDVTFYDTDTDREFYEWGSASLPFGGDSIDINVANYFVRLIKTQLKIDLTTNIVAFYKFVDALSAAKIAFYTPGSKTISTTITITEMSLSFTLTKTMYETALQTFMPTILGVVQNALTAAKLTAAQVSFLVMVGGGSRLTYIQTRLEVFKQ